MVLEARYRGFRGRGSAEQGRGESTSLDSLAHTILGNIVHVKATNPVAGRLLDLSRTLRTRHGTMHSRIPLLLEALWFCGISVSAVSVGSTESNPKPGKDFGSFAQALGVSASQISCLAGKYAAALTDNALLDLACLTAGVILGEEQVQSEAVNQTVVDVNWYVPTFLRSHAHGPMLTWQ